MELTKASITNKETNEVIKFGFNPGEYTVAKTNPWQSKPVVGKNVPKVEFTGGGPQTLTFDLFFDAFEEEQGDVRTEIDKLFALTLISSVPKNKETQRSRPPRCIFQWGPHWSFTAVVMNLSVRYTLFSLNGTPVRATAKITLQEAEDDTEQTGTNPTSYSLPGYKRREVRPRDTLSMIAYEEYGSAAPWRLIADENGLEDPLDLRPGQILGIPPLS